MYFCWFYPTGLDVERRRHPWLTLALLGSLLAVFAWQNWGAGSLPVHPWSLIFYVGDGRPWTAVTALFLHAGWLHLLGNLIYLWAFLPTLEDRLGPGGALVAYLLTGVAGNLAHGLAAWQGWAGQGGLGILGASGAISGLLGYALLRLPYARVAVAYWVLAPLMGQSRAGRAYLPLPGAVALWLLLQLVSALVAPWTGSGVSYPAHLGGFAAGALLALSLGGVGEGRAESHLARARRYLRRGEGWAAAGEFTEYLEQAEPDPQVQVEQARALTMAGAVPQALESYRQGVRQAVRGGRWDLALEAYLEGRRGRPGLGLAADELAAVAHRAEKAGRQDVALRAYRDLILHDVSHPAVPRAWVRLVLLLHADPASRQEAAGWLERARDALGPGAWRDYLDRVFIAPATARAGGATVPSASRTGPGS